MTFAKRSATKLPFRTIPILLSMAGALGSSAYAVQTQLHALDRGMSPSNPEDFFGFGNQVKAVGDVSGDGIPDIFISTFESNVSHFYSGANGSLLFDVEGGQKIGAAGDLDGDGTPDVIVSGHSAGELVALSGANGNTIRVWNTPGQNFIDPEVATLADRDGDGLPEILITNPNESTTSHFLAGRVYVFSSTGSILLQVDGTGQRAAFGGSVDAIGDLDGDGVEDLIIGAPGDTSAPTSSRGVFVLSGANGQEIYHFLNRPGSPAGRLGTDVTRLGDANNDGIEDFAIAAPYGSLLAGATGYVEIRSGADGMLIHSFEGQAAGGFFGSTLANAGDVDGDGINDLLIGEPQTTPGRVHVVSGSNAHTLYILEGPAGSSGFGRDLDNLGDINVDGSPDFVVAGFDVSFDTVSPNVWIYSGRDAIGIQTCSQTIPNSAGLLATTHAFGSSVVSDNAMSLRSEGLPANRFGYFLIGSAQGSINVPGAMGTLCLGGLLGRYNHTSSQIQNSGPHGTFQLEIDLLGLPVSPSVPAMAGQTWFFQAWYRDMNPTNTTHFTSAIGVTMH